MSGDPGNGLLLAYMEDQQEFTMVLMQSSRIAVGSPVPWLISLAETGMVPCRLCMCGLKTMHVPERIPRLNEIMGQPYYSIESCLCPSLHVILYRCSYHEPAPADRGRTGPTASATDYWSIGSSSSRSLVRVSVPRSLSIESCRYSKLGEPNCRQ